jgi:tetratricopeptide (TPR) repeat protein
MSILPTLRPYRFLAFAGLCLAFGHAVAQENKTVIGPRNADLYHGANALLAGDAEEGVRLTMRGLQTETSRQDRITAMSNLCAGYIMLEKLDTAVSYCDQVIEQNDRHWRAYSNRALAYIKLARYEEAEQDLQKAEALAANSRKVKTVRAMLLDATDPVEPEIVIDDRRQAADDGDK